MSGTSPSSRANLRIRSRIGAIWRQSSGPRKLPTWHIGGSLPWNMLRGGYRKRTTNLASALPAKAVFRSQRFPANPTFRAILNSGNRECRTATAAESVVRGRLLPTGYASICHRFSRIPPHLYSVCISLRLLSILSSPGPGSLYLGINEWFASNNSGAFQVTIDPVLIPAAVWLFGSGLVGLVGIRKKNISVK